MGHFFGLQHTFQYAGVLCLREPVTRGFKWTLCINGFPYSKRCAFTGDLLCDTDADPNMGSSGIYNLTYCNWDPNGTTDQFGDTYHPDPINFMAYGNSGICRSHFTNGQKNIIHFWGNHILNRSAQQWNTSDNNRFDRFEPDEAAVAARDISPGETQSHTFHSLGRIDAVDWLKFKYPDDGALYNYKLVITQISNAAVGTVNFYLQDPTTGNAGVRLASSTTSSISGNQVTYTIPCGLLTRGSSYLIELPRNPVNSPFVTSDYDVQFNADIVNPITVTGTPVTCLGSNGTFNVNNVPIGATINWSKSNNLTYIAGQSTPNYTVSANSGGSQPWG